MAAKSGDDEAAAKLVADLVDQKAVATIARLRTAHEAIYAPVVAVEVDGCNAIPSAFARYLVDRAGAGSLPRIVQSNAVGRTGADGFHRIATPAAFDGPIEAGQRHILVDDHVGLGGALADLRAHIKSHAGRVVGATTLTKSRDSHELALRTSTLHELRAKHGQDLEEFWIDRFECDLAGLTEPEAGHLARAENVDAIRARVVEAASRANRSDRG